MPYNNETYAEISPRLSDWVQFSSGGNVGNPTLDLLNRAQNWLIDYLKWEGVTKRVTLSITNKVATLPSDLVAILSVYEDADSDGRPDTFYYASGNTGEGYLVTDSFTKAAGQAKTITFFNTPNNSVTLEYQGQLYDFTGEGTEYSFFPGELLIRTAQLIHIEETGLSGAEMGVIRNSQAKLAESYRAKSQYNNRKLSMRINDALGNEVFTPGFDLAEGESFSNVRNRKDRSFLSS